MSAVQSAIQLVTRFLRLMEERQLDEAEKLMAVDARIIFPGGVQYDNQRDMVTAVKGRYQWIKKTLDRIDAYQREDGNIVVIISGTLYGINRHGVHFESIRYIDRFDVRHNLILGQDVWNDLAESGVLDQTETES